MRTLLLAFVDAEPEGWHTDGNSLQSKLLSHYVSSGMLPLNEPVIARYGGTSSALIPIAMTPLEFALEANCLPLVSALISLGADTDLVPQARIPGGATNIMERTEEVEEDVMHWNPDIDAVVRAAVMRKRIGAAAPEPATPVLHRTRL